MKKVSEVKMNKMTMLSAIAVIAIAVFILGAGTLNVQATDVIINGGGDVVNNNSGLGDLCSIGGFTAKSTGPADGNVYPAKGKIQSKATATGFPKKALLAIHGDVVCIANLGDEACGATAGGNYVWEIRFLIARSSSSIDGIPPPTGCASLFVQDNGTPGTFDFADENFDPAAAGDCSCNLDLSCDLEPVLKGNFTVHDMY